MIVIGTVASIFALFSFISIVSIFSQKRAAIHAAPNNGSNQSNSVTRYANVIFDLPESVQLGDTIIPEVILDLKTSIKNFAEDNYELRVFEPRVSVSGYDARAEVAIDLQNPSKAFYIERIGSRESILTEGKYGWRWGITAEKPGTHTLIFTVSSQIVGSFGASNRIVESFDAQVNVSVTKPPVLQQIAVFIALNYQWIITAILIPLILYVFQKVTKRKSE